MRTIDKLENELNTLHASHYNCLWEIADLTGIIKEAFVLRDDDTIEFTGNLSDDSLETIRSLIE